MIRASERAAELAKQRKALETKLLAATIDESDAEALLASTVNELELRRRSLFEKKAARRLFADRLSEMSKG